MKNQPRKSKYTITALILCIFALLTGKPISEFVIPDEPVVQETVISETASDLTFRSESQLKEHYQKHGSEMGFENAQDYLDAANRVIADPAALHKQEKEDGDDVYYLERTNEFVIVSKDGYIRTYFYPGDGIDYFNRQ